MRVEDAMSVDVVTAAPELPLRRVAAALVEHQISGMPVVTGDAEIVGVISETDLLARPPGPGAGRRRLLGRSRGERSEEKARVAAEAMSSPAITIAPHRGLSAAARLLLEHRIGRLPVVQDGRLVGIVSRADVVRAFARSDQEVGADARAEVDDFLSLVGDFSVVETNVEAGEARLAGLVRLRSTAETLSARVARVPGVLAVVSRLTWLEDDSRPRRAAMLDRGRYPA